MKNTIIRILVISILILSIFWTISSDSYVFAAPTTSPGGSGGTSFNPDTWKPSSQTDASNATQIQNIGNSIIGFIQAVGSVLSVAVLAILGIKYMTGSVEEKAQYKKSMMPYVIGAIMIFAITNVLAIIIDIVKGVT